MTDRPSVDHGMLSPSGHVSKRARSAALKRTAAELFPPGFLDPTEPTPEEATMARVLALQQTAATLRGLAERGMRPRKYRAEAERLEAEAAAIAQIRTR